jgi:dienelactone hydrolase
VLQHGSGGYVANIDLWSRELNELGISTFALDSFTGRGLTEANTNQALLGRLNFILDLYRALEVLASHPRVDPGRIVLMGFSRGGRPPCMPVSSDSIACGTNQVWNLPPMCRSIRIA